MTLQWHVRPAVCICVCVRGLSGDRIVAMCMIRLHTRGAYCKPGLITGGIPLSIVDCAKSVLGSDAMEGPNGEESLHLFDYEFILLA